MTKIVYYAPPSERELSRADVISMIGFRQYLRNQVIYWWMAKFIDPLIDRYGKPHPCGCVFLWGKPVVWTWECLKKDRPDIWGDDA